MRSPVGRCQAIECAYNKEKACNAAEIKIGKGHAQCEMFTRSVMLDVRRRSHSQVRNCRMTSCKWNRHSNCSAQEVDLSLHEGHADCATYMPRVTMTAA